MTYNQTKLAVSALTAILAFSGTELNAYAANINSLFPSAGVEKSLEDSLSMKKTVKEEKKAAEQITTLEEMITESAAEEVIEEETAAEEATPEADVEEETDTEEETEKDNFSDLVIAKVSDYVNVRSLPSLEGEIVGKLYNHSVGTFLGEEEGWYKIQSGNCTGYVKAEYCITGEEANALAKKVGRRTATVNTVTLNVRREATTDSSILGQVPIEEVLTVIEELDGWVKVKIEEGSGYVSKEYVTLGSEFVQAESKEEENARLKKEEAARQAAQEAAEEAVQQAAEEAVQQSPDVVSVSEEAVQQPVQETAVSAADGSLGQQVVDYALQFVGNPYVYGGTSLTNGADCSGFVMSVYANFGVSLPHSSSADRKVGYSAGSLGEAIPGDIVCYSGHVGIYAGNGQIVHASNSRKGIIVSDANYDTILAVRRIF